MIIEIEFCVVTGLQVQCKGIRDWAQPNAISLLSYL